MRIWEERIEQDNWKEVKTVQSSIEDLVEGREKKKPEHEEKEENWHEIDEKEEKEGRRKYALLFIEVSWYFVDDRKSTCPWDNERIRQVVKPVDGRWIGIICSYKRRRWWYWLKNDWSDWKRDCSFEEDDRMER